MTKQLIQSLTTEAAGEALSALYSVAKSKAGREEIESLLGDREVLYSLVRSESPKVRKNAYRLLGALENSKDEAVLSKALETETTLFAVPSIILALGNLGAEQVLRKYSIPRSENPEMDKHIAAIASAYSKAMRQFDLDDTDQLKKLDRERTIRCLAPKGFGKELHSELRMLGFSGTQKGDSTEIFTSDIERVYRADCMVEALLPIAENVPLDPGLIAESAGKCIGKRYRIELRGYLKNRSKFIESLSGRIDGINNPSHYDCELRIECRNTAADLYWKLWNVPDSRYPWRTGTIPASIHPATASALAFHLKSLIRDRTVDVLDPFCGSGSLLFAAEKVCRCGHLVGVDQNRKAIDTARKNAEAVSSRTGFVCCDILRFRPRRKADIVLSNMPFGNRVGNHRDNERLYTAFLNRLPDLMKEDGTAILYTCEGRLLSLLLERSDHLICTDSFRTEAGGLTPWVYTVRCVKAE